METTDRPATSTLDRLRHGPAYVRNKPRPRIAAFIFLLLVVGCTINVAGSISGYLINNVAMLAAITLSFFGPYSVWRPASEARDGERELAMRASDLANRAMLVGFMLATMYLSLAAESEFLPHPTTARHWQQIVTAIVACVFCLNQLVLHVLAAKGQAKNL